MKQTAILIVVFAVITAAVSAQALRRGVPGTKISVAEVGVARGEWEIRRK